MFTPTKEMLESIGMNEYCDSSWSIKIPIWKSQDIFQYIVYEWSKNEWFYNIEFYMNPFYPQSLDDAKKMIDLLTKK